jgi:hypothetical protein
MSGGLGFTRQPALIAAIASGAAGAVNCQGHTAVSVYLTGTGTTSSGVVTIETADFPAELEAASYSGTWSAVTTVNASTLTGGQQTQVILAAGCYSWVRVRVSTVIGGGGSVGAVVLAAG